MTAHAPWFEKLRAELLQAFDDDEGAEADGDKPGGGGGAADEG
ncbi:hypothetical protein AAG565_10075 [Fontimonas sp. SYSU GA230001]